MKWLAIKQELSILRELWRLPRVTRISRFIVRLVRLISFKLWNDTNEINKKVSEKKRLILKLHESILYFVCLITFDIYVQGYKNEKITSLTKAGYSTEIVSFCCALSVTVGFCYLSERETENHWMREDETTATILAGEIRLKRGTRLRGRAVTLLGTGI